MKLKRIRCIVIDEDSRSLDLITDYIGQISELLVVGHYSTSIEALLSLIEVKPEIVFLNADTPYLGGLSFVKLLPMVDRPAVVVITGSESYAIECFEQRVSDYLVLPFTFERFARAIERVLTGGISVRNANSSRIPLRAAANNKEANRSAETLIVKERKKSTSISVREIVLIEGMKDYLKIHRQEMVSVIHMTMASITKILPSDAFLRVSKSYIIQKSAVIEICGNLITLAGGKKVPIGATYKKSVFGSFKSIII